MDIETVLPLLQAGGSISTIGILILLFKLYRMIVDIKTEVAVAKTDQTNTKERVDKLEKKVYNGYAKENQI